MDQAPIRCLPIVCPTVRKRQPPTEQPTPSAAPDAVPRSTTSTRANTNTANSTTHSPKPRRLSPPPARTDATKSTQIPPARLFLRCGDAAVNRFSMAATARCPGAAGVASRWTARSLAGAFLDAALVLACLCAAAAASFATRLLSPFPCTCARPHLPCLLSFLLHYPSRALSSLSSSLLSRFPFAVDPSSSSEHDELQGSVDEVVEVGDARREVVEERGARAALQRELEKERSAAASAAEEAMAMILRLQKEKSALEIEARQQRRTADERCAFYEDEVEELRDILLVREREARALRKEVDAYRRLLGLATDEDEDEEEDDMVTPHSTMVVEGEPSSSKSVDNKSSSGNFGMAQLGNDYGFSLKTPFSPQQLVTPIRVDHHLKGVIDEDMLSAATSEKIPVVGFGLKKEVDSCEDDGTETVEILPLSARSLDQVADVEPVAAVGTKSAKALPGEYQEVECGGIDKSGGDSAGSENDANIYDVHVVDDICFSTEVKGLIGRCFSDATMQAEKIHNRVAADDLLGKSLNAIKGAQDKIKIAASERKQSLQLQLLEDIANQLQEIKDAAEAGRQLHCASPRNLKKS
uniref:GTD-binding domain-containing protein n=1 Tax=Leersia perrieri TaxID=77586 RepID=A0A0D9W3F9_9ORYZ